MQDCIHGIPQAHCSVCSPQNIVLSRVPREEERTTLHGSFSVTPSKADEEGYAVIRTTEGRNSTSFQQLDAGIKLVHIQGHLFLWALEKILEEAPNLRQIRVIPRARGKLGVRHEKLCREYEVEIITGHHRPSMIWKKNENRSPFYQEQQSFLLNLKGEQKRLFDEMLLFRFEEAEITARYFCLNGENYIGQRELGLEYGFDEMKYAQVSSIINAVLVYLDPTFEAGNTSLRRAEDLRRKVRRIRKHFYYDTQRRRLADKLLNEYGYHLAGNFPLARVHVLIKVLRAYKLGRMEKLRVKNERQWKILMLYYGIDSLGKKEIFTLADIGRSMNITRERVRQLKEEALAFLRIED